MSKFARALEQAEQDRRAPTGAKEAPPADRAPGGGRAGSGTRGARVDERQRPTRGFWRPRASSEPASPGVPLEFNERARMRYQKLRLLLNGAASRSDSLRSLLCVGCRAATGATTTAALLAQMLAEENRRVLLVDANLRTPALHIAFGLPNQSGLYDVLVDEGHPDPVIHETLWPRLSLLTAGRLPGSQEAVFEGKRVGQLLADLKTKFDFVILDSAPVLESPDAYGLAPEVDGILLVVDAERTPVHEAQQAKRDLELAGGRMIGAILNRERDYTPRVLRRFFR